MRDLRRRFPEELRKLAEKPPVDGPEKPGDGGNTGGDNGTKPGDGGNAGEDNGTKPGDGGNAGEDNGTKLEMVEIPEKTMAQDQEVELVHPVQTLPNRRSVKESRISAVTVKRDILIL